MRVNKQGHLTTPVGVGGPEVPLCQQMYTRMVKRLDSVKCKECARRSRRLEPWLAYMYRANDRAFKMRLGAGDCVVYV